MQHWFESLEKLAPSWVLPLAIIASLAAHLEEAKAEDPWKVRVMKWFTRTAMAVFAAVMTWQFFAKIAKVPDDWLIWCVGIGAHMGVEAIRFMKELWADKLKKGGANV